MVSVGKPILNCQTCASSCTTKANQKVQGNPCTQTPQKVTTKMLEFVATNMQELRTEIVEYLRIQMRNQMAQVSTTDNKQLHSTIHARAWARATAADALETAVVKGGN